MLKTIKTYEKYSQRHKPAVMKFKQFQFKSSHDRMMFVRRLLLWLRAVLFQPSDLDLFKKSPKVCISFETLNSA